MGILSTLQEGRICLDDEGLEPTGEIQNGSPKRAYDLLIVIGENGTTGNIEEAEPRGKNALA
jgi:hypothetical protein